jgi:2-haloacid dehalogenase
MRYRWVLFDADGTLFDYDAAETAALEQTFRASGQPFQRGYAGLYRQINVQIWQAFERGEISPDRLRVRRFEQLLAAIGVDADPQAFSEGYLRHLAQGTALVEDALDVVQALHGNVGLLIITNGLAEVQRERFEGSALRDYFPDLVISEEVGAAKPDGRIFEIAFQRMNNPRKEEVLMVGDSLTSDIQGGNQYGIDTCWFNPGGHPRPAGVTVCYEIRRLGELLRIVWG